MKEALAQSILQQVQKSYETVANEFSVTRERLQPALSRILDFVKDGDRVLDVGCGNGRFMDLFVGRQIDYIGIDNVTPLVAAAHQRCLKQNFNCRIMSGNAFELPFEQAEFNVVICAAVLHHVPGAKLRLKVLKEIYRVLKPDGIVFLTVWNLWQPRYRWHVLQYNIKKLFGQSALDWNDLFRTFFGKTTRYLHAFRANELRVLIKKTGFSILDSYYVRNGARKQWFNGANLIIIAKK